MGIGSYILFGIFAAFIVKKFFIDPEAQLKKQLKITEDKIKNNPQKQPQNKKNNSQDFYGIELLQNNPDKFLTEIKRKDELLKKGEAIGVDATQAFFLIRNARHHELIVGETGTINMLDLKNVNRAIDDNRIAELQKEIMEYQPEGRDPKDIQKVMSIPPYVKEVKQLSCGGVRWVFEKWHADECGISSLCFDRYSRAMPDPDAPKEDSKAKREPKKNNTEASKSESELKDLSKKVSRVLEMEEERRVDMMLSMSKDGAAEPATLSRKEASALIPAEYKDEIKILEEEFEVPNFSSMMDEDFARKLKEDLGDELLESQLLNSEEDIYTGDSIDEYKHDDACGEELFFDYENVEQFSSLIDSNDEFIDELFDRVFSENGRGYIFLTHEDSIVYVEKNYFVKSMESVIDEDRRRKFHLDFIMGDNDDVYDGGKVNKLLEAMNKKKYFERLGASGSRMLFNMLFESDEKDNVYYLGWYLKIKTTSHYRVEDFAGTHAESVEAIASNPRDIADRSKHLTNINRSF